MVELLGQPIGLFRGFSESELEYRAEIVSPYHSEMNPLIGEFLMVDISGDSALLGRITRFVPVGVLSGPQGDDYMATLSRMRQNIPEDLKESKLRYNVNVKLLGTIFLQGDAFRYEPGVRELPHLGAFVAKASQDIISYVCGLGCDQNGAPVSIGHLALGNNVFDGEGGKPRFDVKFDLRHLQEKRSFIFARSGYGKSNLVKLLISKLYEHQQDVGMLIFDPEGEYAFGDFMGRPGLADLPHLRNKVVVFTDQRPSPNQESFVQGPSRINLAAVSASRVVNHCIVSGKQETVFASRLRGCNDNEWRELVNLLDRDGYRADEGEVAELTHLDASQQGASVSAVISNLVPAIRALHRRDSNMAGAILHHLRQGHVVIVDVRSHSRSNSERLAGMILTQIFQHNQRTFQAGTESGPIRTILVLEEAQSVLSPSASDESPFVAWAKEGRKYGLGTIMITQQPGALARELLSQGDNFFAFHLISASDLNELRHANAHFSRDILTQIINEPIPGNCYYWSAPHQPFVLCSRIYKFEDYAVQVGVSESTTSSTVEPLDITEKKPVHEETVVDDDLDESLTAAEKYRQLVPTIENELDEAVRNAILNMSNVRLCGNPKLDGDDAIHIAAVKLWNLSFSVAQELSNEALDQYGSNMRDGSDFVADYILEESLSRVGFISEERRGSVGESMYFLLSRQAIEDKTSKGIKDDELELTSE